jgi:hypothetical protein
MSDRPWSVEWTDRDVHVVRISMDVNEDWEQWGLLRSDAHHDNPHCRRDMELRHLEQAKARGAFIIDAGDLFCAMQGKYDPRSAKRDMMPDQCGDKPYLDALVDEAAAFYAPYADNFALLGRGNHDESIRNRLETDLVQRLSYALGGVPTGGYRGFVRFMFTSSTGNAFRASKTMFYTHGAGGGGPVTKGVIKHNRRSVYTPDADIVVSGHIHEAWYLEVPRFRLSKLHRLYKDTQYHVQLPTYKEEDGEIGRGWHNERESPPKPLGAWWVRFYYDRSDSKVKMEFHRAT